MELEKDYYLKFTSNHKQLLRFASDNTLAIHSIGEKSKHDLQFKDQISFSLHSFTEARNGLKEELLAVGTKKGSILLIDYKTKKVRNSLSAHSGSVDCVQYDAHNNLLYSTGQDKTIKRWDLSAMQASSYYKIEKKGITGSIIVCPFLDENHVLYTVQNSIYLLNFATKSIEAKYNSQCTTFTTLATLAGSKTFLAFSRDENISLFMNDSDIAIACIDTSTLKLQYVEYMKSAKGRFIILGHNTSTVYLWFVHINKGTATVQNKTEIRFKIAFIDRIQFVDGSQIIVAAKREEAIAFNIFSLVSNGGDQKDSKQIEAELTEFYNSSLKKSTKKGTASKTPTHTESYVIGEAELFATKNGAIEEEMTDTQTNNRDSQSLLQMFNFEKTSTKEQVSTDLRNESLSVVLLQALHNNDQELIEFCFQNDDELVLEATIKQVLVSKIPTLVEKLIAYLNSGNVKSKNLLLWLKITLKHHNFLIMQNPKLVDLLRPLVSILRKRTENIGNLMKLKGKIDLLLNAQESYNSSKKQSKSLTVNKKPLVVYEEGDDKAFEDYVEVKPAAKKNKKGTSKTKKDMVEEEEEDQEKDFSSSVSVSDEDDLNQNFDTYLQATADDLREDNEEYEEGSSDAEFIEFDN